jgi:hypothetical protein
MFLAKCIQNPAKSLRIRRSFRWDANAVHDCLKRPAAAQAHAIAPQRNKKGPPNSAGLIEIGIRRPT